MADNIIARLSAFHDPAQKRALELLFQDVQNNLVPPAAPTVEYGVAPGSGITAQEFCADGYHHTTVITLAAPAALGAIAGGAALGLGKLVYTLPAGAQTIDSSYINVAITQTQGHITANTPTVGLGTVVASGVVSVLSGTATFQNINVGIAAADCNGTATEQAAVPTTGSGISLITDVGGTKTVYFNVAATWSASGDAGALLTGTITLNWTSLA